MVSSKWRLRQTPPGSRVTRITLWCRLATLAWRKWRSRQKKNIYIWHHQINILFNINEIFKCFLSNHWCICISKETQIRNFEIFRASRLLSIYLDQYNNVQKNDRLSGEDWKGVPGCQMAILRQYYKKSPMRLAYFLSKYISTKFASKESFFFFKVGGI